MEYDLGEEQAENIYPTNHAYGNPVLRPTSRHNIVRANVCRQCSTISKVYLETYPGLKPGDTKEQLKGKERHVMDRTTNRYQLSMSNEMIHNEHNNDPISLKL